MNNVVDEVLNTSATQNKVKYKITYSNNTSDIVELDLYTPVTTQGTPINRTLFESIRTDLTNLNNNKENVINKTNTINSSSTTTQYPNAKAVYNQLATKLNISSKSTTAQAQAGTDDTTYMTPLKTFQAIDQKNVNKLLANYSVSGVETQTATDTIWTNDNKTTALLVTINLYGTTSGTYRNYVNIGNLEYSINSFGRANVYVIIDRRTGLVFDAVGDIGSAVTSNINAHVTRATVRKHYLYS